MNISFVLDREEQINPNEALGDIIISNNKSKIVVISTYLDSWFDVLIDGYKNLENNNKITLEIVEEPELITFFPAKNGFNIRYGKQEIFFCNIQEFYLSLLQSAQDFIREFEQENINISHLPLFTKINNFLEQSSIKI